MLAPEFLPVWGGVGTYIVELIRHLPRSVEVFVVAPSRDRVGRENARTTDYDFADIFPDNIHVDLISSASDTFIYNAAFQCACLKVVPRLVKDENVDLIHSHTAHMPDLLMPLGRVRVPTLTTVHTTIAGQRRGTRMSGVRFGDLEFSEKATYLGYPILSLAERIYFSSRRSLVTVSNWMREQLLQQFPKLRGTNISVIHNSVDCDDFTPSKESTKPMTVLFTGRFIAAKGLNYLVDAIPEVIRNHPETQFLFVGAGHVTPYEKRLQSLSVPKRNYSFLGYLNDRKAIIEVYRRCTVFVAPTLYENLPIRILEAMACGKPVVATNVCAIPEIIRSDEEGLLVPPQSSHALAVALSSLLGNPELRSKIGRNARERVTEHFNWATNGTKMANLYEELSNNRD
jgi:glycosyltransferase involved in cell wall biosynthesis